MASPTATAKTALEFFAEPPYRHLNEQGLRSKRYRAPTPTTVPGAQTLTTTELIRKRTAAHPALVLIDVQPITVRPESALFGISWLPNTPHFNIPGSVWLPNVGYAELDLKIEQYFRSELKRLNSEKGERSFVFYCTLGCWMSWNAVQRATHYGYKRVFWYREGTDGWAAAGQDLAPATPVPLPDEP